MKTEIKIGFADYWQVNIVQNLKIKRILLINAIKDKLFGKGSTYYKGYCSYRINRQNSRLSPAELEELIKYQETTVNSRYSENKVKALAIPENITLESAAMYQRLALLCEDVLKKNPGQIKTVANVGARVDVASGYLAGKYPDTQFYSIDFQTDLEADNNLLEQHPNWHFQSGYALDVFERKLVQPDLVMFSSTSVLIRNKELDLYLQSVAKTAKFVIFNEPWWPPALSLNIFKIVRPEEISPTLSETGGSYGMYIHNYPAILERNGFQVEYSRLVRVESPIDYHNLQLLAKKKLP